MSWPGLVNSLGQDVQPSGYLDRAPQLWDEVTGKQTLWARYMEFDLQVRVWRQRVERKVLII